MKKLFTAFALALITISSVAQSYPTDGYYRVRNKATNRYVYVSDNEGSINLSTTSAELGALCLWMDPDRRFSDPASVIYVKTINASNHQYDLQAQETGVYRIIQHYVSMYVKSDGFQIYAEKSGMTKYLSDDRKALTREDGLMGTSGTGDYRIWLPKAIDANSDEYFGIKPGFKGDGKYYHSFFAAFPFSFASSGMKAYYVSKVDVKRGVAVISEFTDDVKPGGVPFIIECSSPNATDNRLNILGSGGNKPAVNELKGCYFFNPLHVKAGEKAYTEFNASTMRVLSLNGDGKPEFANGSTQLQTSDMKPGKKFLPANQGYLVVPTNCPAHLAVMTEQEYNDAASGITECEQDDPSMDAVYSLTGVQLRKAGESSDNLPAGIYVIGGRKVQIR